MIKVWRSVWDLFYPQVCMGCKEVLVSQENMLCTSCLFHLPGTDFHFDSNNEAVQLLKGKFRFEFASSMLILKPGSIVEELIYNLKYNNHPQVGYFLGQRYGFQLMESPYFKGIDVIIPIPLHPKRFLKRGYNQSEVFARGLSRSLGVSVDCTVLKRRKYQKSQTKMTTEERITNVEDIFICKFSEEWKDKRILLVDDVLTTGSTITSAAEELLATMPDCKLYIASIARA